jgi:RHS repeat-associated protein
MRGISSKAAGKLQNKKKYNSIEFNDDLDIDTYEAFFRNLDPQTGRWWQIDPEVEGQESLSPYNSMANDPILRSDPLGDVPENSQEYSEVESNESSENCCPVTVGMWQAVRQSIVSQGPIVGRAIAVAAAVATVATIIYDLAPSQAEIDAANAHNAKVGASIQTGPSYTMGTTPSLTITPPKPVAPPASKPAVPTVVQTEQKKQAPVQTASGNPTDKHGNKLGPSGKPQVNTVKHPSQKKAKDAARKEGKGAPVKHPNPKKGKSHYHPTDKDGNKKPTSTHHEY